MSATSRRKAGKWLAICTVNEEVLVGMRKGILEVSRIFVGEGMKKNASTRVGKPYPRAYSGYLLL